VISSHDSEEREGRGIVKTYTVRDIPEDLFERFKSLAQRERRSMNAELIEIMDKAVQQDTLRQRRHATLHQIAELRHTLPARTREGKDSLTLLREDRNR
jgi:plasmid stability protein